MADDLGYQRFVVLNEDTYIDQHTNHPAVIRMSALPELGIKGARELNCSDCHMPEMGPERSGYDIYSHRFLRDTPDNLGGKDMPNACLNCHTKESKRWVKEWLKKWSPDEPE